MGFGFGKKKKNISSDTTPAAADIKTTLGSAGDADSLRIRISVLSAVRNAQSNNSHTQGAVKKLD